jgi:hypothetical protein
MSQNEPNAVNSIYIKVLRRKSAHFPAIFDAAHFSLFPNCQIRRKLETRNWRLEAGNSLSSIPGHFPVSSFCFPAPHQGGDFETQGGSFFCCVELRKVLG